MFVLKRFILPVVCLLALAPGVVKGNPGVALEAVAESITVVGTRENERFRVELLSDHSVRVLEQATGATADFTPHFTVKYRSTNPGMNTGLADEPVSFRVPQWGEERDFFAAAGANLAVTADGGELSGDQVLWSFATTAQFGLSARIELPPGNGEPRLSYDFIALADGYFSIGFTGAPELETDAASWFWQPLIWQEKRFPKESYLTQEFRLPIPAVLMGQGSVTIGVGVDPEENHFRLPTWNDSRFGVILRNAAGRAQPMVFAPIYGGEGSQMLSGDRSSFSLRLIVQENDWYRAYRNLGYNLYEFSDYRENNGICSLNETIDNLVDFILTDQYSYWYPEFKTNGYQNDAPGYGRQQSAVYALALAMVRDSEEIFERRSLPTIEYIVSRRNLLFNLEEYEENYGMRGPVTGSLTELAALHQMSGGRTAAFGILGERSGSAITTFANDFDPWAGFSREEALDNGKRRLRELIAMYRLTGQQKYLDTAQTVADYYILWRLDQPATDFFDAHSSFWHEIGPIWDALYEVYQETGTTKYLDATVAGMEQFAGFVHLTPSIPDTNVLVNHGGVVRGVPAPEEKVPAWRVSEAGLTPEAAGTSHSHRGIFMAPYAAYMARLAHFTGDPLFHDIARSAIIGRYCNYPSYAYRHFHTTVFEKQDYPLRPFEELTFTSQHYNHPLPQALFLIDYLVSETFARSEGQITFPSRYTSTGAYFRSQVYGDRPGTFYDREGAWLWLPKALLEFDHPQVNYLAARGEDALFLTLTNQSDQEITVTGTLNPGIAPYAPTHQASLWIENEPVGDIVVQDGQFTVTLAPKGITALAIEGLVGETDFQHQFAGQPETLLPAGSFQEDATASFGKVTGMQLSFGGELNSAYIWLDANPEQLETATLGYFLDGTWNEETKTSYPFEFTIPLGPDGTTLPFFVRGHHPDGTVENSPVIVLEGTGGGALPTGPFYFDPTLSEGGGGDSWETAFNDLDEALFAASTSIALAGGDEAGATVEIYMKGGEYSLTQPLQIENGIQLYGGFSGTEQTPEGRELGPGSTTILTPAVAGIRLVEIPAGDSNHAARNIRLDGFTFSGARDVDGHGGAIRIRYAEPSVVIANSRITDNSALQRGGGVAIEGSDSLPSRPTFINTRITNNLSQATGAQEGGGGIYFSEFAGGTLQNCVVSGNRSEGLRGGGIYMLGTVSDPLLLIEGSRVSNNSVRQDGGGIFTTAPVTIRQSILTGNEGRSLSSEGQGGGAIFTNSTQANIDIDRTVVSGNLLAGSAGRAGGGAFQFRNAGTVSITNSIISGNSVPGTVQVRGAAAYFRETNQGVQVVNTTFADNVIGRTAGNDGGVINARAGSVTFSNNLYAFNNDAGFKVWNTGEAPRFANLFYGNEGGAAGSEEPVGDPMFVSDGENAVNGTWATVEAFESNELTGRGTTRLIALGAPFAGLDLVNTLINLNTSQRRQALIISHTDSELLVEGDAFEEYGAAVGGTFKLIDYRPEEGSAVIGAADSSRATEHDFLGKTRPQGTGPDVGAFEFVVHSAWTYLRWRNQHFDEEHSDDPEVSGPLANPVGDGISNLLKYAFGLDPWTFSGNPQSISVVNGDVLRLTYTRSNSRTDLDYRVEASENLHSWSSDEVLKTIIETDGDFDTIQAEIAIGDSRRIFLRLIVVLLDDNT